MTDPDVSEFVVTADEADQLRRTLESTQLQLKRAKAKTGDLVEAVERAAHEAFVAAGPAKPINLPARDKRTQRAEVAWVQCTDWHFGKETPSFNSAVAAERVKTYASKIAEITEIERAAHPVRECHVAFLGDGTEGIGIFPGQAYEVDSTLFQQLMNAATSFEGFLQSLLAIFDKVVVWLQTGNHGRIGKRGDMPRGDNTDRLLYQLVMDRFKDERRLEWHMPTSWYTIAQVGTYRALLVHGDQIKSFGGTPVFAILKKANSWASGVLPEFRDVWMGHFHVDLKLSLANGRGKVFVGPSIESDSAFAAEVVAASSFPAQRLCFVDPDKGRVTSERMIELGGHL